MDAYGAPPGPGQGQMTMTVTTTMTFTTMSDQPGAPPVPPPILLSWLAANNNPMGMPGAGVAPPPLMMPGGGGGFNQGYPPVGYASGLHSHFNGLPTPPGSSRDAPGVPLLPESTPRKRSKSIVLGTASMSRKQGRAIIDENSLISIATSLSSTPTETPSSEAVKAASPSVPRPSTAEEDEEEIEYEEVEEEIEYEDYEEEVDEASQKNPRQPSQRPSELGTGSLSMNPRNVKKHRKVVMRNTRDSVDSQNPLAGKGDMPSVVSRRYESFLPKVMVLYEWEARSEDELTLRPGNVVIVYEKDPSGWWRGRIAGSEGTVGKNAAGEEEDVIVKIASFPYNYTRPLQPTLKISQKISPKIFETQLRLAEINEGKGEPDDTYAVTGPTREELEAQRRQQHPEQQQEQEQPEQQKEPQEKGDDTAATSTQTATADATLDNSISFLDDASALLEVLDEMEQITSMFDAPSQGDAAGLDLGGLDSISANTALSVLAALEATPVTPEPAGIDSIDPPPTTIPADSTLETPPPPSSSTSKTSEIERKIETPEPEPSTPTEISDPVPAATVETPSTEPPTTAVVDTTPTPDLSPEDTKKEAIDLLDACLDLIDSSPPEQTKTPKTDLTEMLATSPTSQLEQPGEERKPTVFGAGPLSPRESASPTRHKMMIAQARSVNTAAVLANIGEQAAGGSGGINATSDPINAPQPTAALGAKKNKAEKQGARPKDRRPTWIPDQAYLNCMLCKSSFTLINRRHHCRNCGMLVCHKCCAHKMPLPQLGYNSSQAVCNSCAIQLSSSNS